MAKNTVVKVNVIKAKVSPMAFHRYASKFFHAAKSLDSFDGFSMVQFYLYCQSVELALKGFLLEKDFPNKDLKKKIRHNLKKLRKQAEELGLNDHVTLSNEDKNVIAIQPVA